MLVRLIESSYALRPITGGR